MNFAFIVEWKPVNFSKNNISITVVADDILDETAFSLCSKVSDMLIALNKTSLTAVDCSIMQDYF